MKNILKKTAAYSAVFFSFFSFSISGLPDWASPLAERSLEAVLRELPSDTAPDERNRILSLVADQIFRGFEVSVEGEREPAFSFKAAGDVEAWTVELVPPALREPVNAWFARDVEGLDNEILKLVQNFPIEALSWSDTALRESVKTLAEAKVPGWDFSLLVRLSAEGKVLQISFVPVQPFILSINTSVKSNALPVMFQTDLSAKLITDMSPIIGLPVAWAALHEHEISQLAVAKLEDRNAVFNIRASVSASFTPEQISKLETNIDSERFFLALKLAAYAGSAGRVPELWLTAGWRTEGFTNLPLDLYSETLLTLDEFELETRLGARFEFMKNYMVGAEIAYPDEQLWLRFWWDDRERRPYAWWRWNEERGHNFALGYRLRHGLALELHYDRRYDDHVSVRGILQF